MRHWVELVVSIMVRATNPFASHTGQSISPFPPHCSQPGFPAPANSSRRFGSTRSDSVVSKSSLGEPDSPSGVSEFSLFGSGVSPAQAWNRRLLATCGDLMRVGGHFWIRFRSVGGLHEVLVRGR